MKDTRGILGRTLKWTASQDFYGCDIIDASLQHRRADPQLSSQGLQIQDTAGSPSKPSKDVASFSSSGRAEGQINK